VTGAESELVSSPVIAGRTAFRIPARASMGGHTTWSRFPRKSIAASCSSAKTIPAEVSRDRIA